MEAEGKKEPDPLGAGAGFLDAYLPNNLVGRYAFYVILATTVLITSVSTAVTPISLVFGLLALPVLIVLAALIVNFAIVFLEVNEQGSTNIRRRAARSRLIILAMLIFFTLVAWQPIKFLITASWRDIALIAAPWLIEKQFDQRNGPLAKALDMIPPRRPSPAYLITGVGDLSFDSEISSALLQRLQAPSEDITRSTPQPNFDSRTLLIDGDLLRALSDRPAVTVSGQMNLRRYVGPQPIVIAAREVYFDAGTQIELGANTLMVLAEKLFFGSNVRIVGFIRSSADLDKEDGQPATGDPGLPSGSLTLVEVWRGGGEVSVDLRGQDGRRGRQGKEQNPIERPAKDVQKTYSEYLRYWQKPEKLDLDIEACRTLTPPTGFNRSLVQPVVTGRLDENVLYLLREQACGLDNPGGTDQQFEGAQRRAVLNELDRCQNGSCERRLCLRNVAPNDVGDGGLAGIGGHTGGEGGSGGVLTVATSYPADPDSFPQWVHLTRGVSKGGEGGAPGPAQRGGRGARPILSGYPGLCPSVPEGPRGDDGPAGSPGSAGTSGAFRKPVFLRLLTDAR